MSSIKSIIDEIKKNSDIECDIIIKNAQKNAEDLAKIAQAEGVKEGELIVEQSRKDALNLKQKAVSSSQRKRENIILAEKSKLMDDIIKQSKQKFLKSDEYFDYLVLKACSDAQPKEGVLSLNKRDLDEFGDALIAKVNSVLKDDKKLKLDKNSVDIDGGFILNYDTTLINSSIGEIINAHYDDIRDKLNQLLF